MKGDKYRVSVAGFLRDGISDNASLEATYGHAMYHWGIWVEPKNNKGAGRLYHMEEHETMNSQAGPIPGGWRLGLRDSNSRQSHRLIGRILIGKLPEGNGFSEIDALLNQVPAPVQGSGENCITWSMNAIRLLQSQSPTPWADSFDVDEFMDYAYRRINSWHIEDKWRYSNHKDSYVGRKF